MSKKSKIKLGELSVRAGFQPDSFNEEDRTIEVVFSDGAIGKRYSYSVGEFYEELSMKRSHWNLERLNKGAPVLDNHNRRGLNGVIGVVEKADIINGQGVATIRFSERDEVQGIVNDIKKGIIRNVSVGYRVHEFKDVSKKGDSIPTYRAVNIEPYEVSFVDVPFDMNSQSRSQDKDNEYDSIIIKDEEHVMNREEMIRAACEKAGLSNEFMQDLIARDFEIDSLEELVAAEVKRVEEDANPTTPVVKVKPEVSEEEKRTLAEEATKKERARISDIEMTARTLNVETKLVDEHKKSGTSADKFRELVIKMKADEDAANPTRNHIVEGSSVENKDLRIRGAEQALLNRFDSKFEISKEGEEFRNLTLVGLARNILSASGENLTGMTDIQVAERAMHSSSDFKQILANVANKSLRRAYAEQGQTFGFMTRSITVNDFKEISRTQLGDAPVLEKVNEHGEYEHGTVSDAAEKYSLQTYGKIVSLTRKTIVNDDLGAFTRLPSMFGRRARDLESELIYNILKTNPLMADGNALFSAAHGNIALGGDVGIFDVEKVGKAREAMRLQTGLDGLLINLQPRHMLVPVALETKAEQFLGATVPQLDDNVNPFKGKLSPVAEPRLDAGSKTAWYLAASTDQIDMIEIARLAGEEGPMLSTKEGFEVDGIQFKIRYDFAAKVLDWRGFYKNAGV